MLEGYDDDNEGGDYRAPLSSDTHSALLLSASFFFYKKKRSDEGVARRYMLAPLFSLLLLLQQIEIARRIFFPFPFPFPGRFFLLFGNFLYFFFSLFLSHYHDTHGIYMFCVRSLFLSIISASRERKNERRKGKGRGERERKHYTTLTLPRT